MNMSSGKTYSGILSLSLAFLGLSGLSCRVDNPDFGEHPDVDKGSNPDSSTQDSQTTTEPAPSGHVNTNSSLSSTETSAPESSSSTPDPSQTKDPSNAPSSTTESTPVDPDELAAQAYCQHGSIACYPMISVEGDRFKDYGKQGRHFPATGLSTVEVKQANYPLPRAVDASPQGKYQTLENYTVLSTGVVGFDIWLKPIRTDSKNWTAFAIDKYISLIRMDNTELRCAFEGSSQLRILDRAFAPKDGEFHHVACAFDGTEKIMWVDGFIDRKSSFVPTSWPPTTPFIFGWKSVLENPFDGFIGAIRVWEDIEAMKAEIRRTFPNANN